MKLLKLEVDNFLRLGQVTLDMSGSTLHLLGGLNEAGKSSVSEAVRYALTGETVRVEKKSDYKHLIKDGAKAGTVGIKTDCFELVREVGSGKIKTGEELELDPSLPFVLDAQRFLLLDGKKRRDLLFEICGITHDQDQIRELLVSRGLKEAHVDKIMPMIRAGFDAARDAAKRYASESRGAWKALTGETYGSLKAQEWRPTLEPLDLKAMVALEGQLATVEDEMGGLKDGSQGGREPCTCPTCDAQLVFVGGELHLLDDPPLKSTEEDGEARLAELFSEQLKLAAEIQRLRLLKIQHEAADATAKKAEEYAADVWAWTAITEALAPDGIPGELLVESLKPINKRLQKHAVGTGWPQVMITPNQNVLIEGRSYQLQSRSAQWRTQAMIAETLAHVSGIGLLILDEIDILDFAHRRQLIDWILSLEPDYDTVLLIGTLKEPPTLPEGICIHWLEEGVLTHG